MSVLIGFILITLEFLVFAVFDGDTVLARVFRYGSSMLALFIGAHAYDQWKKYQRKLDEIIEKDKEEERKRHWGV